jgi:TetR/AcrR family transcriptional regulator
VTSALSAKSPRVVEAYWRLVDETVFGKYARELPAQVKEAGKR